MGRRAEELFDVETIADDLVFPVCSPQLAKTLASEVTPVELNKLPLLHWDYDNNEQSIGWSEFLASYRLRQNSSIEGLVFSSYQVCLDVAEQGEGVALGWARSVKHRIDEGKLIRITDMSLHVPDGIAVYLRKHVNSHPLACQVINEVRNSISLIGDSVSS